MNIQEIKALIEALQASDMTSFSYQKDGLKLKIEKNPAGSAHSLAVQPVNYEAVSTQPATVESKLVQESPQSEPKPIQEATGRWVSSPLVGVYYGSPSPNSPSFVKIGDTVKKGDVLCIIEAMKVMNEITAEVDGKILEIAVSNESLVEFGQPLVLIG